MLLKKDDHQMEEIAVTIDMEDWYHLPPVTGAKSSSFKDVPTFFENWAGRFDYLSRPTYRVLDILEELNIKATFFAVADMVENYPRLVETIASKGHEIACHGLHHACVIDPSTKRALKTPDEFREETIRARELLQKASGQDVIGYRAPNAYVAGWMIDILEEIGFKYDSSVSVNSFYSKSDLKLKTVQTRPYYPQKGELEIGSEKRGILEIPWPYFQCVWKFPTGGGPILRILGAAYIRLGIKQSLKRGDTLIYFHPIDMSCESFPMLNSLRQRLFWAVKGDIVERRIRSILADKSFKFVRCRDIYLKTAGCVKEGHPTGGTGGC
jgi:peptidoglycan/xylan/chitin deacetylase (PgdA/CDA1 family)